METVFAVFTCFGFDSRFCRSPRMSFLPGTPTPAFYSPWRAHRHELHIAHFHMNIKARSFRCSSSSHKILRFCGNPVMAVASPENISHSDGRSIFKVQVRLQEQFNEKTGSFPYVQAVGNRSQKRRFPRLWTRTGKAGGGRHADNAHDTGAI